MLVPSISTGKEKEIQQKEGTGQGVWAGETAETLPLPSSHNWGLGEPPVLVTDPSCFKLA